MIYKKLLYDYVNPANRVNDSYISISEKRLRWLKYEAFGSSSSKTTCFNVRHAHTCNRSLQEKLGVTLTFYASNTGRRCNEIEYQQEKLWADTLKRKRQVTGCTDFPCIDKKGTSALSCGKRMLLFDSDKPFSTFKQYTICNHSESKKAKVVNGEIKPEYDGYVELLKFDHRSMKKIKIISTNQDTSLRSQYIAYGRLFSNIE